MGILEDLNFDAYKDTATDAMAAPAPMSPQQANDRYAYRAAGGEDAATADPSVVERDKAQRQVEAMGPVTQRKLSDPLFRSAVAGKEESVAGLETSLEKVAKFVAGDGDSVWRNSIARGMYSWEKMVTNIGVLQSRTELDHLRNLRDAGNATPHDIERITEIEGDLDKAAKDIVRQHLITTAMQKNSPVAAWYDAYEKDGWAGVLAKVIKDGPFTAMTDITADIVPESFMQFLPFMPAVAAAGATGTPGLAAVTAGGASALEDVALGFTGQLQKFGVDPTKVDQVAYFLKRDNRFGDAQTNLALHSIGPGAFDMVSFGMGGKMIPKTFNAKWTERMPRAAAWYQKANENTFKRTMMNLGAQTALVQAPLGMAGEAAGQLLEEGEISDPLGVLFEGLGEIGTGPMEASMAAIGARRKMAQERRRAEQGRELLKHVTEFSRDIDAASEEARGELINDLAEEVESVVPQASTVTLDVATLHQSNTEALELVASTLSPERGDEIRNAVETGGAVELSLQEFMKVAQQEKILDDLLNNSSLSGSSSVNGAGKAIADIRRFSTARYAVGQSKEFKASLQHVADLYRQELMGAPAEQKAERVAALSLTMAHVAEMAADTGMMPEEIWATNGIMGVLTEQDVQQNPDGTFTALTEKGKQALADGSLSQGNRGDFIPSTNTIIRWANADRSTLMHETGHWFLLTRARLATQLRGRQNLTEEQRRFVDLTEKAIQWMGVKDIETFMTMDLEATRAAQEKFAATYEQYLNEGKAPNSALVSVFRRFSTWLRKIYGALTAVKGSDLDASTRDLFDHLFVSHQQVQEAIARRNLHIVLENARRDADGNIADDASIRAIQALYSDLDYDTEEAFNERGTKVIGYLRRLRDRVKRDLEKEAKQYRQEILDEEIINVLGTRLSGILNTIETGIDALDKYGRKQKVKPKFFIDQLKSEGIPQEQIDKLSEMGLVSKSKGTRTTDAEEFAILHDYTGVAEMVQDLTTDRFGGKTPEEALKNRIDQRMADEHPDIADTATIEEMADAAVFNPTSSKIAQMELAYLSGAYGKPVPMELFDTAARASISDKVVSDLRPETYRKAAEKAAARAQELFAKGDRYGAAKAKREQLLQMRTAMQAQEIVDKANEFAKKMGKQFKPIDPKSGYRLTDWKQIRDALCDIGILDERNEGAMDYADYASQSAVAVPAMPGAVLSQKKFGTMSVAETEETMQFIADLSKAARENNTIVVNGRKQQLEKVDSDIASSIEANVTAQGKKPLERNAKDHETLLGIKRTLREFIYAHRRFATMWSIFEGKEYGVFHDTLGVRVDNSRDTETEMTAEKAVAFDNVMRKLLAKLISNRQVRKTKRFYPSLDGTFDKEQIIAMALQIGNDENFDALLRGSDKYEDFRGKGKSKWTRDQVLQAIGETLTYDELALVQELWNICGSLGKDLADLDARTSNTQTDLIKSKAVTLKTADGKAIALSGGYYPIKYDSYFSGFAKEDTFNQGLNGGNISPNSSRTAHSRRRRGSNNPVELTLAAGYGALKDVIHDLAWRETIIDINKLMSPNSKTREIIHTYFGNEAVREINSWVRDVASNGQSLPVNKWLNMIRKNTSMAGLGLNVTTALLQPIGITQSVAIIGAKYCGIGISEYLHHPKQAYATVMSKSAMMRSRSRTRFKELLEVQHLYSGGLGTPQDALIRHAFAPIMLSQVHCVDIPTWIGAYQRYLEEGRAAGKKGSDLETYAVSRADRAVVTSQGSGNLSDLSSMERKKSVWNVFYSFFGTALNAGMLIKNTEKGFEKYMDMALIFAVAPVIESFLRAAIDGIRGDDDDDYLERTMKRIPKDLAGLYMNLFVYGRELASVGDVVFGDGNFGYGGPSGLRPISDAVKFAIQAKQGEIDKAAIKSFNSLFLGDLIGMPSTEINRVVEALAAWDNGDDVTPLNLLFGHK